MLTEENGEAWMTEERQDGIVGAYLARADALELLHIRLGHMPYQRIERMIRRQIIKGYKLDSKTLKALLRERCDVCIRSKKVDAPHKGQLPLPKTPWVNFSTDLSAAFDRPSLYGNIYQMVIIDNKSKYVWDYYLKSKDQAFDKIKEWLENEIGLLRGRDNSNYEIVLFSDMGEANSRKVIDICKEYGVVKQRTGGYTPEHNAFAERWFRTNAEMSTCQMLQFDLPENMWEDSRRMATFIYNRVPPTRQTPGEEWLSPHEKQYPTRQTMDLARLQPFGIPCWVYQKKPIRDKGYSGKSDKKERAVKGRLVGYNDSQGPLHVKVYYPDEGVSKWHPEELLVYADAMTEIEKTSDKPKAKEMESKPLEYFKPMVGTRHTDPEDGITYETTEVKTNKQGYIVAYRREICKGKPVGSIDGPYHILTKEKTTPPT